MKQSENGDNGDVVTFRERFPYRPGQVHRDDIPDEVVDTWRSRSGWDQWFPPQDLDPKWEDAYWHTMNRDLTEEERENGWRITETEYGKIYRQEEINGETDEQPLNRPPPELDDGEEVVITPRGLVRVRAEVDGVSATASKGSTISILENNRVKWALGMFAHHPQLRDLLLIGDREDPVRQAFRLSTHFIPTVPQVLEQFDYGECARVWRAFVERHRAGRDLDAMGVVSDVNPIERSYEPVVPNELWQLFDEIYDPPEYADGDPDEARQWIIRHVLRPALVEWPLRCAVERNEGVTAQVIEWSTRIEAAFETHLEQAGESHGPFTTDQFRQQTEDREELVSGVLVANQLGLVAAATKSMKTTCMVDMAISLATSTPWLGNETWQCCEPKRVFFCSAESGQETLIHKHDVISNVKRAMLPVDQQSRFDCLLADNLLWDSHLPDLGDA